MTERRIHQAALKPHHKTVVVSQDVPPALASNPARHKLYATSSSHSIINDNQTRETGGSSGTWLFFSGLYPISLGRFDFRSRLLGLNSKELENRVRALLDCPEYRFSLPLKIDQVEPRHKEGGAFVRFTSSTPIQPALLRNHLLAKIDQLNLKPFWLFTARSDIHLVKGKPWLEDMNMYPNRKVLVEFEGPVLSQEELWTIFRPFGRVKEINMPAPKDPIQIAYVTLDGVRSAAIARSCLHGVSYQSGSSSDPTTKIRILYSPRIHAKTARDWLGSHPKIVLPVLALLLGGISYTFFEPIRQFFVKSHIVGTFDLQQNTVFSWLQKETVGRLGFGRDLHTGTDLAGNAVERERGEAVRELDNWLSGPPGTFIVILGPKGSGKSQVVQSVLNQRRNSLVIDCASLIQDATNENMTIVNLAKSLGYFPQFSFLASVNNAIDMAAAGLVGQKVGFSSSPEDHMHQILDTAEKALRDLAKEASNNRQQQQAKQRAEIGNVELEKESVIQVLQQAIKSLSLGGRLSDDASDVPVVVLRDFSITGSAKHRVLWECLAGWAARLTETGTAHVVFTSENSGALKPLAQAFSTRPVKSIVLTDASIDSALQYVSKRLSAHPNRKSSVSAKDSALIQIVGGRLTDLDSLVEKIEGGLNVERAIDEIVRQSMEEIKRKCFAQGDLDQSKQLPWANYQVWDLIKRLSSQDVVPLYPILSETFEDDLSVLSALESTDLITLSTHENGETMIRVGKPVYRTAIAKLLSQEHFSATHDLNWAKNRMKRAEVSIQAKLQELIELGKLFPTMHTVGSDRRSWLFGSTLPPQIRWKVHRILDDLHRLEKIVDSSEKDIQVAKSTLYSFPRETSQEATLSQPPPHFTASPSRASWPAPNRAQLYLNRPARRFKLYGVLPLNHDVLAECVAAVLPLGTTEWNEVLENYKNYARRAGKAERAHHSLRTRYRALVLHPNPTGNLEDCPPYVRVAKQAATAIEERSRLLVSQDPNWAESDEEKGTSGPIQVSGQSVTIEDEEGTTQENVNESIQTTRVNNQTSIEPIGIPVVNPEGPIRGTEDLNRSSPSPEMVSTGSLHSVVRSAAGPVQTAARSATRAPHRPGSSTDTQPMRQLHFSPTGSRGRRDISSMAHSARRARGSSGGGYLDPEPQSSSQRERDTDRGLVDFYSLRLQEANASIIRLQDKAIRSRETHESRLPGVQDENRRLRDNLLQQNVKCECLQGQLEMMGRLWELSKASSFAFFQQSTSNQNLNIPFPNFNLPTSSSSSLPQIPCVPPAPSSNTNPRPTNGIPTPMSLGCSSIATENLATLASTSTGHQESNHLATAAPF
ncbi:hypothetical protein H4Q26_013084 [Puccinia striiformis f. sp. tritici PST-130]|uniref:Mitochondrial escape protein 2 n=1 Tax=Puccinia striiformis f. sp. tritici PST-78 TaxID=1165861 RepID=A0A0L0UU76_9BASI|nr:hypothetical protein H4Q26_013084 [Puccinia striiformis f. sp. tritici PST-130]KNE90602.1 hypothetical protein PSTG_15960 [Puccinia striiformis f. sp. tritici PST-78]